MKLKDELEGEIKELYVYLTGPGMPGLKGGLVDGEGFPIFDAEKLISIKTARGDYARKQNDYTAAMKEIDRLTQSFFAVDDPKPIKEYVGTKSTSDSNSNDTKPTDEEQSYSTLQPVALVKEVSPGSPAYSAGLFSGDLIVKYGTVIMKPGVSPDDALKSIGAITLARKGETIPVVVKRISNREEYKKLSLIPQAWSGRGLLGCHIIKP
eukprot:TRINITY_DN2987_c0_g1_i2.p1 TRINITY_DN2987_c0_g1~~TRINITY_DN2987_c0_g1_i2.p1  ORF type:complete len:209 (+),score=56.50 TRINITY_DN2987_c0_g1_i2:645-1271(+)